MKAKTASAILGLVFATATGAQSDRDASLGASALSAGGGIAESDRFQALVTMGQPVATPHAAVGDRYSVAAGFLTKGGTPDLLFADSFE